MLSRAILLVPILMVLFTGCATLYFAPSMSFTVVDASTREPIEDVTLLAIWPVKKGHGSVTVDYLTLIERQSGPEGRIVVPSWEKRVRLDGWVEGNAPVLMLFKPGYYYTKIYDAHRYGQQRSRNGEAIVMDAVDQDQDPGTLRNLSGYLIDIKSILNHCRLVSTPNTYSNIEWVMASFGDAFHAGPYWVNIEGARRICETRKANKQK